MASHTLTHLKLSWDRCPPELLWIIFKQLDNNSLLSCIIVNRRWKDIAIDVIESHGLWPKIQATEKVNMNCTVQRKSVHNYKDMVMNSRLWAIVMLSSIELHHTYPLQDITRMHVYKENLILKTDSHVNYYNIMNTKLTKSYESTSKEIDYTENDYMIVIFVQEDESISELRIYGKADPDDTSLNKQFMYVMDCILLYRLEDNICYIITQKYVIWALIWNDKKWILKLRGRYYGNVYDKICAMHVFNKRVSMVTKHGLIFREDPNSKKFVKVYNYRSVPRPQGAIATNWVLFNQNDVAVSVGISDRLIICHESEYNHMRLECADMTCVTEHEEILFIGYKDGVVAICIPNFMRFNAGNPQRLLQVRDFDQSIDDPTILALEVYEDKRSQHLFVATRHKVLQLLITYPSNVRSYLR